MAGRECLLARFRSLSLPTFSIGVFSRFFLPYFRMRNASSELTYVKAGVALVSISMAIETALHCMPMMGVQSQRTVSDRSALLHRLAVLDLVV